MHTTLAAAWRWMTLLMMLMLGACSSPTRTGGSTGGAAVVDAANPDPSVRIAVGASPMLTENAGLKGSDGVVGVYDIRGTHNRITLYFAPRTDAPECKDLRSYAAWADNMLKEREIREIEIRAARNPVRDAGFPYVARTYVNVKRPGQPAPTAICDAAGMRFETPGGFWTISWNSDLGKIDRSMPALEELLRVMEIRKVR